MKIYLLVASLLILFLSNLSGAVKNGYEKSVPSLMLSLQGLRTILYCDSTLSRAERRDIKRKLKLVINKIAYYRITDSLLKQFRTIAPDLYNEIDTLRDAAGKVIDVYVKYIPGSEIGFRAPGISSLTQAPNDANSCNSEYGEGSVSVIISSENKTLRILAHEFGHLIYVVPNMKSYAAFFRMRYKSEGLNVAFGHDFRDQSGRSAFVFEHRFRRAHKLYLREKSAAHESFMVHLNPVRKELLQALAYR